MYGCALQVSPSSLKREQQVWPGACPAGLTLFLRRYPGKQLLSAGKSGFQVVPVAYFILAKLPAELDRLTIA